MRIIRITAVAIIILNLYAGIATFLDHSNSNFSIDHSKDFETDLQLNEEERIIMSQYGLSKNGHRMNHTGDRWIPNAQEGIKAGFKTIIPITIVFLLWKLPAINSIFSKTFMNQSKVNANMYRCMNDLMISLHCSSPINQETPAKKEITQELVERTVKCS
jgi:hypothetical protein